MFTAVKVLIETNVGRLAENGTYSSFTSTCPKYCNTKHNWSGPWCFFCDLDLNSTLTLTSFEIAPKRV